MRIKTQVKAGGASLNDNETLVGGCRRRGGVRVKTRVKAGGGSVNHNETLARG